MRFHWRTRSVLVAACAAFLLLAGCNRPRAVSLDQQNTYSQPMRPGSKLSLDVSSGGIEITGSDAPELRIEATPTPGRGPQIRVGTSGPDTVVHVRRVPRNSMIHIDVPKDTYLEVSMGAGRLRVRGVEGNKDLTLRAGLMEIEAPAEQYRSVDGFVLTGKLQADPMGIDTGGLFRRMSWRGSGRYSLNATLLSGKLRLSD